MHLAIFCFGQLGLYYSQETSKKHHNDRHLFYQYLFFQLQRKIIFPYMIFKDFICFIYIFSCISQHFSYAITWFILIKVTIHNNIKCQLAKFRIGILSNQKFFILWTSYNLIFLLTISVLHLIDISKYTLSLS